MSMQPQVDGLELTVGKIWIVPPLNYQKIYLSVPDFFMLIFIKYTTCIY